MDLAIIQVRERISRRSSSSDEVARRASKDPPDKIRKSASQRLNLFTVRRETDVSVNECEYTLTVPEDLSGVDESSETKHSGQFMVTNARRLLITSCRFPQLASKNGKRSTGTLGRCIIVLSI